MREDFTIRPGRREDAAEAARLWMQSADEHTAHDRVYKTSPDAEKTMRRFLADVANSGYSFLFVAVTEDRTVGFISGELRQGSPTFLPKTWASVDDVFVEPEHRNRGMGRALFRASGRGPRRETPMGSPSRSPPPTRGAASSTRSWGSGRFRSTSCSSSRASGLSSQLYTLLQVDG